jgi:isoleucyl-tRNA synthetase
VRDAYNDWQFHLIEKEIINFCNTDLSAFYLDIVKDRLYCSGPTRERKSAQTALYAILTNLLPLLAPVLAFTAEEAYLALRNEILRPNGVGSEESVHLLDFPAADPAFIDDELAKSWETLIEVRKDALKQIEVKRAEKLLGHSLEASVTVYADGELYGILERKREELAPLFVVSEVNVAARESAPQDAYAGEHVSVSVRRAEAKKCPRCWRYLGSVGAEASHPDLCSRCASVVAAYYS